MGLGWGLHSLNHNGRLIFGHGGGTFGQMSMLRIVPDRDICIAVLTNCENAEVAYQAVINELLKELADIDLAEQEPSFVTVSNQQLSHYVGDYQSSGGHFSIAIEDKNLIAKYKDFVVDTPAIKLQLKALDDALWIGYNEQGSAVTKLRFLDPDTKGNFRYLFNGRMNKRAV